MPPHPFIAIRTALARLIRAARALASPRLRPTAPIPASRPSRLARTTEWLIALTRTLAGDRYYHHPIAYPRFPGRYPSLTADLRAEIGLPPLPPPSEAKRAANRLHYMRRVFATQSTGTIAARLARRLGLTPRDPAWPHALIAIATPPARTALAAPPGRRPRHTAPRVTLPRLPALALPRFVRRPLRRVPPAPS